MVTLDRANKIVGWMSGPELQFLAQQALGSFIIFEIGSYVGRSTRALGDHCPGIVYAIDPWNAPNYNSNETGVCFITSEHTFNQFYCNCADLIKKKKVVPCVSTWKDYYPNMLADFIFIDGDHRYEEVKADITKALSWLKEGGLIAGHDYAPEWAGVKRAVDEIFKGEVTVIDTIWSVRI